MEKYWLGLFFFCIKKLSGVLKQQIEHSFFFFFTKYRNVSVKIFSSIRWKRAVYFGFHLVPVTRPLWFFLFYFLWEIWLMILIGSVSSDLLTFLQGDIYGDGLGLVSWWEEWRIAAHAGLRMRDPCLFISFWPTLYKISLIKPLTFG